MPKDFYEALGVKKTDTHDTIKKAYRRLVMKNHPDVNHGSEESIERTKEITEAWNVLGNENKRAAYDRGERSFATETNESFVSPLETIMREWAARKMGAETAVDHMVGFDLPPVYTGGEVEDDRTGDIYSSGMDIKIAKWERADRILRENEERINKIRNGLTEFNKDEFTEILSPARLLEIAAALARDDYYSHETYAYWVDLIEDFEDRIPEYQDEMRRLDRDARKRELREMMGDSIQTELEQASAERSEKALKSAVRTSRKTDYLVNKDLKNNAEVEKEISERKEKGALSAHIEWKDNDDRSDWRKESGSMRGK